MIEMGKQYTSDLLAKSDSDSSIALHILRIAATKIFFSDQLSLTLIRGPDERSMIRLYDPTPTDPSSSIDAYVITSKNYSVEDQTDADRLKWIEALIKLEAENRREEYFQKYLQARKADQLKAIQN
jgi:hypothetical protein